MKIKHKIKNKNVKRIRSETPHSKTSSYQVKDKTDH